MICEACGRAAEVVDMKLVQSHHLGCPLAGVAVDVVTEEVVTVSENEQCAVDGCDHPRRQWNGRGAKPRYCEQHTTGKKG